MRNLKILLILIIVPGLILLTGCWDRRELEELFIPYIIGIDVDEKNPEMLTFTASGPTIEEKVTSPTVVVSTQGKSVREAKSNIQKKLYRRIVFGHTQIIVFGEKTAKGGISVFLDTFNRDPDIKGALNLSVVQGTAKDFIRNLQLKQNPYTGIFIKGLISNAHVEDVAPKTTLRMFFRSLHSDGKDPIMPYLILSPAKDEVRISNTAVFKNDRFIGTLNNDESIAEMILCGKLGNGTISIEVPEKGIDTFHDTLAIRLDRGNTKIVPELKENRLKFKIDAEITAEINEHTPILRTIENDVIQKQNRYMEKKIKADLEETIKKLQTYKSDTVGFGKRVRAKYPKFFKIDRWREDFSKAEFEIKVKVNIKRGGIAA